MKASVGSWICASLKKTLNLFEARGRRNMNDFQRNHNINFGFGVTWKFFLLHFHKEQVKRIKNNSNFQHDKVETCWKIYRIWIMWKKFFITFLSLFILLTMHSFKQNFVSCFLCLLPSIVKIICFTKCFVEKKSSFHLNYWPVIVQTFNTFFWIF